jgi:endonuclease-3
VSGRIGLSSRKDPEKIETDLEALVPKDDWTAFSLLMILHGRYMCKARKPECPGCRLRADCDYWLTGKYEGP